MHRGGIGHTREEICNQVREGEKTVYDWASYVHIGEAVTKLETWTSQGAEIMYLTSRTSPDEVCSIEGVLKSHHSPVGKLLFCQEGQQYREIVEDIVPDILVEDDCESIGGVSEMTITHVGPEISEKIKSIPVKEFGGIDHLPDEIDALIRHKEIGV